MPAPRSMAGGATADAGSPRHRRGRVLRWGEPTWDRLRTGYWLVPTACAVTAVAAAIGLITLDRYLDRRGTPAWTYAGGPQNASDTLSTIASSMITFTGLVFSITLLALQLTSSQFSPRALRNFLRDPVAQCSLGIFVGTFAYAFAALSAVRVASSSDPSFVPAITVTGAFVLIALSVLMFVRYIHHMASSIRVVSIIDRIADETRRAIDESYPEQGGRSATAPAAVSPGPRRSVRAERAGVVIEVHLDALAAEACRRGVSVRVLHPVGAFVCEGQPLLETGTPDVRVDDRVWRRFVRQAPERTMRGDDAFGFRQLVDIAERALSPGINDPTTAVQCLDRIHDLLRRLLGRHLPSQQTASRNGTVRAWMPSPTFEDHLGLALDEIHHWGEGSLQVQRRLIALFDDLMSEASDPEQQRALRVVRRRVVRVPATTSRPGSGVRLDS